MTDRQFENLERRIRRAAAKEGYTIQRKTFPEGRGVGYNVADANNFICSGSGNYEMDIFDVAKWFNVVVTDEVDC